MFWGLPEDAFVEMAGRSEKPVLFGASGLEVGAGEKLMRLGVEVVDDGIAGDVDGTPEVVVIIEAEVELVADGKLYAGGASDFETAARLLPREKVLDGFSAGFDSTVVAVGFVGVWNVKVALLSDDLVGVPKLNPPVAFGGSLGLAASTDFGGSILPNPGSLIGSLIKAAIPLGLGTTTSAFFSSTFGGTASTVSLTTIGAFIVIFGASSSSSS